VVGQYKFIVNNTAAVGTMSYSVCLSGTESIYSQEHNASSADLGGKAFRENRELMPRQRKPTVDGSEQMCGDKTLKNIKEYLSKKTL